MISRNFPVFPVLHTNRLTLRQLTIDDREAIFELRSDEQINQFLNRKPAETRADAEVFITMVNENIEKCDALYWGISLSDSAELAGTICLYNFSEKDQSCEIGFELLRNFHGRGIMQEALEKLIWFAFNTLMAQKIDAFCHRDNLRSLQMLEKFSFKNANEIMSTNTDLLNYYLNHPKKDAK